MEHNDYDYKCVKWYGDRSPSRNRNWRGRWKPVPLIYQEFDGSVMMLDRHRCFICNPRTETEAEALLDSALFML